MDKFEGILHLTIKKLIMLLKKKIFLNAGWNAPIFNHSQLRGDFPDPLKDPQNQIKKNSYLVDIVLFMALKKVNYNQLCLIR